MSLQRAQDVVKACETEVRHCQEILKRAQRDLDRALDELRAARVVLKYALHAQGLPDDTDD